MVRAESAPVTDDRHAVAEVVEGMLLRAVARDMRGMIERNGADGPLKMVCSASNEVMRNAGAQPRGWRVTLTFERCDVPEGA
jgi:hypothetical protein